MLRHSTEKMLQASSRASSQCFSPSRCVLQERTHLVQKIFVLGQGKPFRLWYLLRKELLEALHLYLNGTLVHCFQLVEERGSVQIKGATTERLLLSLVHAASCDRLNKQMKISLLGANWYCVIRMHYPCALCPEFFPRTFRGRGFTGSLLHKLESLGKPAHRLVMQT